MKIRSNSKKYKNILLNVLIVLFFALINMSPSNLKANENDYREEIISNQYMLTQFELPNFDIKVNLDIDNLKKVDDNGNILDTDKIDEKTVKVKGGDNINVPYNIIAEPIEYGESKQTLNKELAILVDTAVSDSNLKSQCKNGIINDLLNNNVIIGNSSDENTRFAIIAYGGDKVERVEVTQYNNYKEKIKLEVEKFFDNNKADSSNNEPQLSNAISKAIDFFNTNGWSGSSKDILIISNREVSEISVNEIKDKVVDNYNVITLDISEDCYDRVNDNTNLTKEEHIILQNKHINLRKVHSILGGIEKDYFISKRDSSNDTTHNDLQNEKNIFKKISTSIGYFKYQTFTLDNMSVNFNLGNAINAVSGLIKKNNLDGDKNYIINIPKIKYAAKMNSNGEPQLSNNSKIIYEPYIIYQPMDIYNSSTENNKILYNFKFTIKPNEYAQEICKFEEPNELSYNYVGYNVNRRKNVDKTPVLLLNTCIINHGIYKGIDTQTKKPIIYDASNDNFAQNSMVTIGAYITEILGRNDINLQIDRALSIDGDIVIYKVDSNGNLVKLKKMISLDNINYTATIDGIQSDDKLLVMYTVRLSDTEGSFRNYIKVNNGKSKDAIINVYGSLPDLF